MHEKGGLELAMKMDTEYSTAQLYKMLELLDVHDALLEQARKKQQAENKKPK